MTKKLTPEQKRIVQHFSGHALVKAVPGSGKTTTLIMRVTNLLRQGLNPSSILILMYNKAAQVNFKDKLKIAAKQAGFFSIPEVRTFHSYALKLVKRGEALKFIKAKELVEQNHFKYKSVLRASYMYGTGSENSYVESNEIEKLELLISNWRLEEVTPDDLNIDPVYKDIELKDKRAYSKYCELMEQNRLRTFDDVLIEAVYLIREHNFEVPTLNQIVVDEYQDVNYIQNEFIKCLTKSQTSVMVVGDVNQCIYEWRGSRPDFIEGIFQKDFGNTKLFTLSCTFRYGHQLSSIANSVIGKNKDTSSSICISHPENPNTQVYVHQGLQLLKLIERLETKSKNKSNAIIGRANADLIEPEIILQFLDIAHRNSSGQSRLVLRPEMSLLTVLFCIAIDGNITRINQHDYFQVILKNFIQQLNFRLDKGQLQQLTQTITEDKDSFWKVLKGQINLGNNGNGEILKSLESVREVFSSKDLASTLYNLLDKKDLFQGLSGSSILRRESNDQTRAITFIQRLLNSFNITGNKLLQILIEPTVYKEENVRFELTTMHGSKGLEWDTVIILGLHDKVYPGSNNDESSKNEIMISSLSKAQELREERRTFYVAITRAINQLHLLVPEDKNLTYWQEKGWSSTPKKEVQATRFVFEMDIKQSRVLMNRINESDRTSKVSLNSNSKRYIEALNKI